MRRPAFRKPALRCPTIGKPAKRRPTTGQTERKPRTGKTSTQFPCGTKRQTKTNMRKMIKKKNRHIHLFQTPHSTSQTKQAQATVRLDKSTHVWTLLYQENQSPLMLSFRTSRIEKIGGTEQSHGKIVSAGRQWSIPKARQSWTAT